MANPIFHRGHYNVLASCIRRELMGYMDEGEIGKLRDTRIERNAIIEFAINLAQRLYEDNPSFDPFAFLDACSPNPDEYPLSEMWKND